MMALAFVVGFWTAGALLTLLGGAMMHRLGHVPAELDAQTVAKAFALATFAWPYYAALAVRDLMATQEPELGGLPGVLGGIAPPCERPPGGPVPEGDEGGELLAAFEVLWQHCSRCGIDWEPYRCPCCELEDEVHSGALPSPRSASHG